ncbi:MAG: tryptophan--tRNA ligase [Clostridium sp.]|jgi:tryptophanyl-tRNA synthetase|nr:tryptophan--tRNA ligase [Clostridium sp.]
MKRILTGLQPSGQITLGNYLGAIKQMATIQNEYESFLFVADLHAITVPQNPDELRANVRSLVGIYLACGVDPAKNIIYVQSDNIYHPALSWILECHTPYGELGRMTQFKDKSKRHESFMAGLLTYPVLMAADIILYDADYVPVGEDQTQHVEFARDLAGRFNNRYGRIFVIPEAKIPENAARIMDLQDPDKKMSKSAENANGVVYLLDDNDTIAKKFKRAVTDSDGEIRFDPENKAGISNLLTIASGLSGISIEEAEAQYAGMPYGKFKNELADLAVSTIGPIRAKYDEIQKSNEIDTVLNRGRDITVEMARKKYEEVARLVGLSR